MRKFLALLIVTLFHSLSAIASESYYLDVPQCKIYQYNNGEITPTSTGPFIDQVINVKVVPKRPKLVAFKQGGQIYLTSVKCVENVDAPIKREIAKKNPASKKINFVSNKYFIEIDTGVLRVGDESVVSEDYNEVFPSTTTNPTKWEKARNSSYDTGSLLSFGFGFRHNDNGLWAFKVRLMNGKKTDSLLLTDINTSITQRGSWVYEDSFKNFYGGYKFLFLNSSAWKPLVAFYLGVSHMTSVVSDGNVSADLSSLSPAALAEVGVEYHLNQHFGIGANLGFEYLGNRNFKFSDESLGKNFKSKMSYNNQYLSLGLKLYF